MAWQQRVLWLCVREKNYIIQCWMEDDDFANIKREKMLFYYSNVECGLLARCAAFDTHFQLLNETQQTQSAVRLFLFYIYYASIFVYV